MRDVAASTKVSIRLDNDFGLIPFANSTSIGGSCRRRLFFLLASFFCRRCDDVVIRGLSSVGGVNSSVKAFKSYSELYRLMEPFWLRRRGDDLLLLLLLSEL